MFRKTLAVAMTVLGLAALAGHAHAADPFEIELGQGIKVWKPYVVEKNCVEDFYRCKVRMDYAPFQRAMVARPGSYWYQKPFQVYRYGDYERGHHHRHHHHRSKHVAWCSDHYRTYDPATDTYVGKGHRHHRCDSPYDGH